MWFGLLTSIFFLFLVFHKIDFPDFFSTLKRIKFSYVFLAFVVILSGLFIRSIRWYYLLYPEKKVPLSSLLSATCVGQAANNLFPFRVGDLIQAYFLGRKEGISKSTVFSTVILERLTDLIILISIFFIISFFFVLPKQINILALLILAFGLVVFFVLVLKFEKATEKLSKKLLSLFSHRLADKFSQLFRSFVNGFKVLRQGHLLMKVFFITLVLWFSYILAVYIMFFAFDIKLNFSAAMFFLAVTGVSVTIPSSPGYIGTWEFFGVLALSFYQIDKELALSFSLVHHLLNFLWPTLLGTFFVLKESISFQEIKKGLSE